MHNTIAKKQKVERAIGILSASIEKVFIDEVQDLDHIGLQVFDNFFEFYKSVFVH